MGKELLMYVLKGTGLTLPPTAIVVVFLYSGFNNLSAKVENIEIGAYERNTQVVLNSNRISALEKSIEYHKGMFEFHGKRINELQRQVDKSH